MGTTILSINGRGHFGPTNQMIKLVKVDHAGQTELKWFTPMDF